MIMERYTRNTFEVDAIQITARNIGQIAEELGIPIKVSRPDYGSKPYLMIQTARTADRPMFERFFCGDWLSRSLETGEYGRHKDKSFSKLFSKSKSNVSEEKKRLEIHRIVKRVASDQDLSTYYSGEGKIDMVSVLQAAVNDIMEVFE